MPDHQLFILFVDLAVILAAARSFGWVAERLGQPPVVGEITAGILAGPTILGSHISAQLFPTDAQPALTVIANVGIALFMFLAGTEIEARFEHRPGAVLVIACSAYAVPFAIGCCIAIAMLSRHNVSSTVDFTLFVGCALAVTAFPVLARILHDQEMTDTDVGRLALASAAIGDVLAWSILSIVIAAAHTSTTSAPWRLLLLVPLAITTWLIVRPLFERTTKAMTDQSITVIALCGALLWAAATEWAGLHLIFGAFVFGTIIPATRRKSIQAHVRPLATLLLPCFFVVAGLRVDLGAIDRTGLIELLALIIGAVAGKVGGTYIPARLAGIPTRPARALAILLNTRGLTELILLNVGLTAGLIGAQLYSVLVVVALITTAATVPLLNWSRGRAATNGLPVCAGT